MSIWSPTTAESVGRASGLSELLARQRTERLDLLGRVDQYPLVGSAQHVRVIAHRGRKHTVHARVENDSGQRGHDLVVRRTYGRPSRRIT